MNSYSLAWGVGGGGGRGGQGIIRWWGHIYVVNTLIKSFTSIIIAKQFCHGKVPENITLILSYFRSGFRNVSHHYRQKSFSTVDLQVILHA